jgi:hypothetical protein
MNTPDKPAINRMSPTRVSFSHDDLITRQPSAKEVRWAHLKAELGKLGMITGREALKLSGLAMGHETAIFNLARKLDTIVAIRPVNDKATSLIASLAAVKGLDDTHLKSASTGPMAGYIPIDPRLGKSGKTLLDNKNAAPNSDYKIDSNKPGVVASPLTIDENRRNELFAKGVMAQTPDGRVVCGGANPTDQEAALNEHFEFRLNDLYNGSFEVQYKKKTPQGSNGSGWKNVEVVAKQLGPGKAPLPMTADYDILGYFPHISNFNNGKLPEKIIGKPLRERFQNLKENNASSSEIKHELIKAVTQKVQEKILGQTDRKNVSPSRGSLTGSEEFISTKLNKALRPEIFNENGQVKSDSAGVLIKHGPEVNNPHPENDQQITIVGPKKMIFVTRSQGQLTKALALIRSHEFVVYPNRQWASTKKENELIKAGKPWNANPASSLQEPPTLKRVLDLDFENHINKIPRHD